MANVPVTAGSGTNIATIAVTRDAVSEQLQAIALIDSVSFIPAKIDANGNQLIIASPIGGAFSALPAGPYTNGVALTSGTRGVEVTSLAGGTVSYTIASAQPSAAPTLFRTVASGATDQIDVNAPAVVYITATTGAAGFYRSI